MTKKKDSFRRVRRDFARAAADYESQRARGENVEDFEERKEEEALELEGVLDARIVIFFARLEAGKDLEDA